MKPRKPTPTAKRDYQTRSKITGRLVSKSYATRYPSKVKRTFFYRSTLTGWPIKKEFIRKPTAKGVRQQYTAEKLRAEYKKRGIRDPKSGRRKKVKETRSVAMAENVADLISRWMGMTQKALFHAIQSRPEYERLLEHVVNKAEDFDISERQQEKFASVLEAPKRAPLIKRQTWKKSMRRR